MKIGSAPNETSALLMEGVLKDAGIPALIRRGAGSALEEAQQLLEDTTGSWVP